MLLGLPLLHVEFGLPDGRILPAGKSSRQVQDEIRANFSSNEAGAVSVVATGIGDPSDRLDQVDDLAADLSTLQGVARVDASSGSYTGGGLVVAPGPTSTRFESADATWFSVVPRWSPCRKHRGGPGVGLIGTASWRACDSRCHPPPGTAAVSQR